ncbi:XdhC family protein [Dactylosporangium sp. NPDC005555]|uniref:XdhC family protein n=1 Tax=Dactylosporangium sp. NPDC005555 TaxID=3154889 RepID=UPI0033B8BB68
MSTNAERAIVAVFDTPVAAHLMDFATTLGFRVALADPDLTNVVVDAETDVVVTDHDRPELGAVLRDALTTPARWIGVMGNPRHPGPHVRALRDLGVPEDEIARVHRPIGLNIGSRTPAEIALATLAGLVADRNGRPGGPFGQRG